MPRPRNCRRVNWNPDTTYFKPAGIKKKELEEVTIDVEELEAIRLKDLQELQQNDAAEKMQVSQPTFHRILTQARKKIAKSIIEGKALKIQGGNFKYENRNTSKNN